MSINQKVKIESNGGLGQDLGFSIFGCKSAKMAITLVRMLSKDQKMSVA